MSVDSRWPKLPSTWKVTKLKRVASLRAGGTIPSEAVASSGDYPVFGGNGVRGYTTSYTHEGTFALVGRQGALCGNVNYATGRFWASEHAVVVTPLKGNDVFWLGELLRSMNLNQYSQSAAQPGLSVELVEQLDIPVPPLPAQRAIANYLDRETARIDALIAAKQQMAGLLEQRFDAAVFHAVAGSGPGNRLRKASGLDWVDEIPLDWGTPPVTAKFDVQLGKMLSAEASAGADQRPYLRNVNVQWDRIEVVELATMEFDEADRRRFALRPGDLLVCEGGEVGRAAIWHGELEECYFQKALHRIRQMKGIAGSETSLLLSTHKG